MSRKRTTAESNNDEQTNEDSDSILQNGNDAKRARLTLSSDTTLQDLPIEMLERILVQAVVMEVKNMKMAKCVWKDKAGLVISRLTTVCSQWSSILTTDHFRNEVNRVLDGTAQEGTRLERLLQHPLSFEVSKVTANKDEIFLLCTDAQNDRDRVINVYDRNNMAEVKDVILLPRRSVKAMAACSISRCVYVLYWDSPGVSMFRLTRDEEDKLNISPWISDPKLTEANISVSANGNLIIFSSLSGWNGNGILLSIYDANGRYQNGITLRESYYGFRYLDNVIEKSNGNFLLVGTIKLTEIDATGIIVRQCQSSVVGFAPTAFADIYGRSLIVSYHKVVLLDSEFNLLMNIAYPELDTDEYFIHPSKSQYNCATNEIAAIVCGEDDDDNVLAIYRLT